jgi:NADH-quinone oxidoreductase subunit A
MGDVSYGFLNVILFLGLAVAFVFAALFAGRFVRPSNPSKEKNSTYECGERSVGKAWFNFNPRFYVVALIFLIFDVEIILMYPVATIYKAALTGDFSYVVYAEILFFILVLFLGLLYVWKKGDLDWRK